MDRLRLREDCIRAAATRFAGIGGVKVVASSITKIKTDAWATAGNSFGDMGGGVDKAIDDYFSGHAQTAVQAAIQRDYYGELPVGMAVVIQSLPKKPALIYAPTMRVPGNIHGTINVYLAMRAILVAALKTGIKSLACPTLGTGVGGIMPDDAADQMFQAHRQIVLGEYRKVVHSLQAPYVMR